jgi:hypothetical protein
MLIRYEKTATRALGAKPDWTIQRVVLESMTLLIFPVRSLPERTLPRLDFRVVWIVTWIANNPFIDEKPLYTHVCL